MSEGQEVNIKLSYLEAKDQQLAGASRANAQLTDALYEAEYQLHNLVVAAAEVLDNASAPEALLPAWAKLQKQVGAAQQHEYRQYVPQ